MLPDVVKKSLVKAEGGKRLLKLLSNGRYDLPLNRNADSRFLILLIALMTFLAILAFTGTFALGFMTQRWSSGLENKMTIEIPVETKEGHLLSHETVEEETQKVFEGLQDNKVIASIHTLTEAEIGELIAPWIGNNLSLGDIPLPGLIAIELKISTPDSLDALRKDIGSLSPYAVLETHQDWLKDLIRFAGTLKFIALIVTILIASTTVIAIAGGIRTRMAIHSDEVELLHLIGATDSYISKQFERHAVTLAIQGTFLGTACGLVCTGLIIWLSTHSDSSLIPSLDIGIGAFLMLAGIPVIAIGIAMMAARFTVLRSLADMP